MNALLSIAQQFSATAHQLTALGNGLINDTFLVNTATEPFVLQRINQQVFPHPELISANLSALNQHLSQKRSDRKKLELPKPVHTLSNHAFFVDKSGGFWRALSYIANSESLESPRQINDSRQTGFALGHFHQLFSNLSEDALHDTLPGFHITPHYLQQYQQISTEHSDKTDYFCQQFIETHQAISYDLEHAKQQGYLKLRIIHGDPKLDNFLFDQDSHNIIGLIDLDTVKPGLVHYDIGDGLRSCCHISKTDQFDLTVCEAWLAAYLKEAEGFFTQADFEYLYPCIRLIPFELGLRFYTDYLNGNLYFKTTSPNTNLLRAQAQFRLCADIINKESAIKNLLQALASYE